ncbi:thiol reductant ABC exporter subunit CydC [Alicyclobacillus fastidiosus]|uniref:Thiol reductant ABC exporter subunit CydC n=1 Tax=Alicyclobacillus fastidiosus TaxID=392011 RepID=A0ABY6ZCR4_9BACL|nr:thiol reductant ABC exporter subunit CydC [Alicyclobacillus fastidiosus]WAH40684.1 thiol reductant ABC exporter subunit CydC [Alicyclobacillus fastidiosus]GMA62150.1 thiol reductant ABC exporter subunit CydC [Alicyclobacillus fastidiosus]
MQKWIWVLKWVAPFRWRILLAIVLGFSYFGANFGLLGVSGLLISRTALHPSTILLVYVPLVAVRFFGLSRAAFRYTERLVSHDLALRSLVKIREWLFEMLERRIPFQISGRTFGDILSLALNDVDSVQFLYIRALAPTLVAVFAVALTFAVLSPFGVEIAVTTIIGLWVAGLLVPSTLIRYRQSLGRRTQENRAKVSEILTDSVRGWKDIKAFCQESTFLNRLADLGDTLRATDIRSVSSQRIAQSAFLLVQGLTTCAVLWELSVGSRHVQGVDVAMIALFVLAAFEAVAPSFSAFEQAGVSLAGVERLRELESYPVTPFILGEPEPQSGILTVRELSFRYATGVSPALSKVSFEAGPGKKIAIVGQSGSGKTTLLNILTGLYPYTEGSIQLNGVELKSFNTATLRSTFAVVSQKTHLFRGRIRDNIALGSPNAPLREIIEAAKLAQIHQRIENMPEGYETVLGERGSQLSGGERQRLALARALLLNAQFLLMDEPTGYLDLESEQEFYTRLFESALRRTIILITHRYAVMDQMDEIIVLKQGRVVERGVHAELVQQGGWYEKGYRQYARISGNPSLIYRQGVL